MIAEDYNDMNNLKLLDFFTFFIVDALMQCRIFEPLCHNLPQNMSNYKR